MVDAPSIVEKSYGVIIVKNGDSLIYLSGFFRIDSLEEMCQVVQAMDVLLMVFYEIAIELDAFFNHFLFKASK